MQLIYDLLNIDIISSSLAGQIKNLTWLHMAPEPQSLPVPDLWYVCCHLLCFHKPFDCTVRQYLHWRLSWKANMMMTNKLGEDQSSIWRLLNSWVRGHDGPPSGGKNFLLCNSATHKLTTASKKICGGRCWQRDAGDVSSRFECQETQPESSWIKTLTWKHCQR